MATLFALVNMSIKDNGHGKMYKPLPDNLTIKTSDLHGQGLFASENIGEGTNLGTSHVELGRMILRTPLGGFINHSNKPNCVKSKYLKVIKCPVKTLERLKRIGPLDNVCD